VTCACRAIWNVGQPLLEVHLRATHVKRPFILAANALAALLQDDNVAAARQHAQAALALDYVATNTKDVQQYRHSRPLDRHLAPLLHIIDARSGRVESQIAWALAQGHIEHARSALSQTAALEALNQASELLHQATLPDGALQGIDGRRSDNAYFSARAACLAWAAIADVAGSKELHRAVLDASASLATFHWMPEEDPEMAMLQVMPAINNYCTPLHAFMF
jgi:hypothetical protein